MDFKGPEVERWFTSRYNDSEVDRTVYVSTEEQRKAFDALEEGGWGHWKPALLHDFSDSSFRTAERSACV